MLQPVAHRLVQQPNSSTCWQGKTLQEGKTFEPVAVALWRRDVALPHRSRPAEQPATGRWGRQCSLQLGRQLPHSSGAWTTVTYDGFQCPWPYGLIKEEKEKQLEDGRTADMLVTMVRKEEAKYQYEELFSEQMLENTLNLGICQRLPCQVEFLLP